MAQGTGLVRALGEHSGFSAGERAGTSGVESGLGERSTETSETGRRRGGRVPESIVVEPRAFRAPVHRDEEQEHDHERDGDESPASTGHGHGVQRPETAAAAPAARPGALQERGVGMLKMHGEDVRNDDPRRGRGDVLLADACGAGFDPARGIFAATAENLAFPAARAGDTAEGVAILELVGVLVGKGLYEGVLQETRFAPHFAKYLLGAPRTMDDLASLDPELRRSLALVLRHDGDVEDLCLDWTAREERFGAVETHELRPGGADRVVTNDDRLAYVHAVADFHLNRRRGAADAAFARGLARIVQPGWLRLFSPPELSQLVSGAEEADVDILDLRNHARYSGGYTETSRAVLAFWEVVRGFTPEERRGLLKFVTSSSRPPASGFRHLHPPFTVHKVRCEAPSVFSAFAGPDVDRLPSASTCFNVLKLPNYRRTSTMREKIRYAV